MIISLIKLYILLLTNEFTIIIEHVFISISIQVIEPIKNNRENIYGGRVGLGDSITSR